MGVLVSIFTKKETRLSYDPWLYEYSNSLAASPGSLGSSGLQLRRMVLDGCV